MNCCCPTIRRANTVGHALLNPCISRKFSLEIIYEEHRRRRSVGGRGVAISISREGWQAAMTDLCSSGDHFRSDFSSQILTVLPSKLPTLYTMMFSVVHTSKVFEILYFCCTFCVF